MGRVFEDNAASIGRTPLVRINNLTKGAHATVLAKIEGRNPAYSVKCRIGAAMVWDAEKRGELKPGKAILEATSGNTGIALAFAAAARGYECVLVMPETMSMERRKVLVALGAKLVLTPGAVGMKELGRKVSDLARDQVDLEGADRLVTQAYDFISWLPMYNVTGQPGMSVPLHWNREGLPIGMHFGARFGDEATLYRLAGQLERAQPWFDCAPPGFAD